VAAVGCPSAVLPLQPVHKGVNRGACGERIPLWGVGRATAASLLPQAKPHVPVHPPMQRGARKPAVGAGGVLTMPSPTHPTAVAVASVAAHPGGPHRHPPSESRRGGGEEGGAEGGMPFNGDEAAVVLPMSSRMLTSSPICRSSASDEAVHSKSPPDPWTRVTFSCESAPDEEPMCALRAVTALAASATLKARARAIQRNRLSAQNEGGGVWCDMIAVGDGATGGSAIAKEICVCRTKTMSCPSDYFIFKILKIRLQSVQERRPTLSFEKCNYYSI